MGGLLVHKRRHDEGGTLVYPNTCRGRGKQKMLGLNNPKGVFLWNYPSSLLK